MLLNNIASGRSEDQARQTARCGSFLIWTCIAVACGMGVSSARAADVRGHVTDDANSPLSGAAVVLKSLSDERKAFTTTTQADGSYRIVNAPFDTYSIEATARGFISIRYQPVRLRSLVSGRDFKLPVADLGGDTVATYAELIGTLR